ncbi:hypothetical protein B0H17DRAFT_517456 [Mycena rosella]|uniref:Uncharacterized protein n=1 Tax=Mycena rosella TaxID=1033263 RepID=A0AAD7M9Z4_MYCRO|nr:hypothetical protein B0H17DRAFT_517456 [Mycena rosella]
MSTTIQGVFIVQSTSNESNDPRFDDLPRHPSTKLSASHWAETETGRQAFSKTFRIKRLRYPFPALLNADNEPLDYAVSEHRPSQDWLESKATALQRLVANKSSYTERGKDMSALRVTQMQYLASIWTLSSSETTEDKAYWDANAVRSAEYDQLLDTHFSALEDICLQVRRLRETLPCPAEDAWACQLSRLLNLAKETWAWAIESTGAQPQAQAMPRPYARTRDEIQVDLEYRPRSFGPGHGVYIARQVLDFEQLSTRRQKCLVTVRNRNAYRDRAILPVVVSEYKAFT